MQINMEILSKYLLAKPRNVRILPSLTSSFESCSSRKSIRDHIVDLHRSDQQTMFSSLQLAVESNEFPTLHSFLSPRTTSVAGGDRVARSQAPSPPPDRGSASAGEAETREPPKRGAASSISIFSASEARCSKWTPVCCGTGTSPASRSICCGRCPRECCRSLPAAARRTVEQTESGQSNSGGVSDDLLRSALTPQPDLPSYKKRSLLDSLDPGSRPKQPFGRTVANGPLAQHQASEGRRRDPETRHSFISLSIARGWPPLTT